MTSNPLPMNFPPRRNLCRKVCSPPSPDLRLRGGRGCRCRTWESISSESALLFECFFPCRNENPRFLLLALFPLDRCHLDHSLSTTPIEMAKFFFCCRVKWLFHSFSPPRYTKIHQSHTARRQPRSKYHRGPPKTEKGTSQKRVPRRRECRGFLWL